MKNLDAKAKCQIQNIKAILRRTGTELDGAGTL